MSQRIKFSTGSYFEQLSSTEFSLIVRGAIWNNLFGLVITFVVSFMPFFIEDIKNKFFYYSWFIPSGIMLLITAYRIFYFEKISVDIKGNVLIKQKCLAGIKFKEVTIQWPKDSYYLNENIFDSYQRITRVWVVAKSEEKKQSKRLIEFSSQGQYLKFKKVLQENYPTLQIREWHD